MWRRIFNLTMFLILGAIINVIVTWWLAFAIDIRKAPGTSLYRKLDLAESSVGGLLSVVKRSEPGAAHLYSFVGLSNHGPGPLAVEGVPEVLVNDWARSQMLPWTLGEAPWPGLGIDQRNLDARGWPLLSFWCVTAKTKTFSGLQEAEGGIRLPERWVREHDRQWMRITTLPYRPIYFGLTFNTVFYAAVLWLLMVVPFYCRRKIRRSRRLCIKCSYDLRGTEHEVCPECGAEQVSKSPET